MDDGKLKNGAAVFVSSYIKRWLEQHYDTLMRSGSVRKLMEAGAPVRYGIEAGLNALVAYADQHWPADTPLRAMFREVAVDAPAELARRLTNGFREEVLAKAAKEKSEQDRGVEQTLLQLDDETLGHLLTWLAGLSDSERRKVHSHLSDLSTEELSRLAERGPQPQEPRPTSEPPPAAKPSSRLAQAMREELARANARLDEQLTARRERRRS